MKTKKSLTGKLLSALFLTGLIAVCAMTTVGGAICDAKENPTRNPDIIEVFKNPDMDSKNMFRWWFPSADVEEYLIKEQLQALYDAGFGGVEVAIVPHWADYDASVYGWGTPKYVEMLKYILKTAKALPEKFRVDITITAHWPPSLNTIDPNDLAASKELSHAYTKAAPGKDTELPRPVPKLEDGDEKLSADFIFTDSFVAASIAKVASVDGSAITLDFDSMKDVTARVTKITDPATGRPITTPAGIPEDSTLFGDKEKLNDLQYYYQVDLDASLFDSGYTPSEGENLKPGDWVLFGFYTRGTGQVLSGTVMMNFNYPMPDRMYATDYYAEEGAWEIIDYWNERLLTDYELLSLMKWDGGDFFEDSIENFSTGPFWTNNFLETFRLLRNYDLAAYLPFIATTKGSSVTFASSTGNQGRIQQDYAITMNDCYLNNRIRKIQEWCHEFNFGYRAQAYGGEGDVSDASVVLDVAEQEGNDSFYSINGGVHLTDKKFVSMEALTAGGMTYSLPWKYAVDSITGAWAAGCNRLIFHGTAYEKETSHKWDAWPGWHAFQNMFGEPWAPRQIHWNDISILADFIARNQAVVQNGNPRVDLAFFKEENANTQHIPLLLDNGYTYEVATRLALGEKSAVVKNGRLAPDGPAYKAILVSGQQSISVAGADRLLELAKSGLPILFYGTVPSRVSGASGEEVTALSGSKPTDADIQAKMKQLLALENVSTVSNEEELVPGLQKLGVTPSARYNQEGMRSVLRMGGDGSHYYYLYNVNDTAVEFEATLAGAGTPYVLDTWTGDITPLALYSSGSGGIQTRVKLGGKGTTIIAITDNTRAFGKAPGYHISDSDLDVRLEGGKILGIADKAGSYEYTVAGGEPRKVSVSSVGEKLDLDTWNLEIESWGPGDNPERPTLSNKTMIPVGDTELVGWDKLSVSQGHLAKAGVESMAQVSGIGYYSTRFELDKEWTGGYGAVLSFEHGQDMVTSIEVNGQTLPPINQSQDRVDIGAYLITGTNTIKMKLDTTLINRVKAENDLFKGGSSFAGSNPPGMSQERRASMPQGMMPEGMGGDIAPQGDMPGGTGGMGGERSGDIPGGGMPGGGGMGGMPGGGRQRVSAFGASGIAGSRQQSGSEVSYGLTRVEIIPYGAVELGK